MAVLYLTVDNLQYMNPTIIMVFTLISHCQYYRIENFSWFQLLWHFNIMANNNIVISPNFRNAKY